MGVTMGTVLVVFCLDSIEPMEPNRPPWLMRRGLFEMRLGLFSMCFYAVWILKELIFGHFQDATFALVVIKLVVWILPVYLYLKYVDDINNPFTYLKLNQSLSKGITWAAIISMLLVLLEVLVTVAFNGRINLNLGIRWVTTLIFAFPEEVLFRGFILQKIARSVKFLKANMYSSLLFVSIHFPNWFIQGTTAPKFVFNIITVFIVGFGLGYLFKKTNSLWSTTIVHTVYNLLLYTRG